MLWKSIVCLAFMDLLRERTVTRTAHSPLFRPRFRRAEGSLAGGVGRIHIHHIRNFSHLWQRCVLPPWRRHTRPPERGSRASAHADRAAVEALVAGQTLEQAARGCRTPLDAMELWSDVKFDVQNSIRPAWRDFQRVAKE